MKLKYENIEKLFSLSVIPVILSIISRIYYKNIYVYSSYVDTNTYIKAGENILNGKLDPMRTPIYPLFLQFCLKALPESISINSIMLIQSIVFILSVFLFHKICRHFIKNKYIVFLTCLFYGCIPSMASWEFCSLTESFSIVSIVIFTYLVISYIEKKSIKYLIITSFYMFLMVMLKPGFIYIYVIFMGFLFLNFIFTKIERSKMAIGFLASVISLSLVFGYIQINKAQNNVNGISIVTDINNFFNVVISGIYKNGSDDEIIQTVDEFIEHGMDPFGAAYETELKLRSYYPVNRIGNFNKEVIGKSRKEYNSYTMLKFKDVFGTLINEKYAAVSDKYRDRYLTCYIFDLNINFFCVYCLLVIEILIIILLWIKYKLPPWGNLGIFMIIFTQIFAAIVGAQGEFSRLISPILPLVIIVIFKDIDILIMKISHGEN